jgi:hypothetical protein
MSYKLSSLLVDLYAELGQLTVSTVSGTSSTSTIVDDKQANKHGDEDSVSWAAFIIESTDGAAPDGEMALVTSYTDSTGTFTSAATSWTVAPAAGDVYGFTNDFYPYYDMIRAVNRALKSLGEIPLTDTTTLDTAASQTEYPYALAWKRSPPIRVDLQTRTTDANDNMWRELMDWEYIPATAGSTGLLVLPQLPSARGLRIWYNGVHPNLNTYEDAVYEGFPDQLVLAAAVEKALIWQNSRMMGGDDFLLQRLNDARVDLQIARASYKPWQPVSRPRLLITGNVVEGDRFTYPDPA